jgi:hypothetical protein
MDIMGKIFVAQDGCRRCVLCDVLFTAEAAALHATSPCFDPEIGCPPGLSYGCRLFVELRKELVRLTLSLA